MGRFLSDNSFPDMPKDARKAYNAHRGNARQRGISFEFTQREWWDWWQIDGRWGQRGNKSFSLVMARRKDAGAYNARNVYCTTKSQNTADIIRKISSVLDEHGRCRYSILLCHDLLPEIDRARAVRQESRSVWIERAVFALLAKEKQ